MVEEVSRQGDKRDLGKSLAWVPGRLTAGGRSILLGLPLKGFASATLTGSNLNKNPKPGNRTRNLGNFTAGQMGRISSTALDGTFGSQNVLRIEEVLKLWR